MKKEIWVIVANSTSARIFRLDLHKQLTEIQTLEHPESRLQSHELVSDAPGRVYQSVGNARHAMEPATNPQKQEFAVFAKEVAKHIDHACAAGKISHFYLAAGPAFLGLLRQSLSEKSLQALAGETDKDLIHQTPQEITKYFSFSFIG